jgi:uncharacterized metal-binding protein YceD (DUF177 family)
VSPKADKGTPGKGSEDAREQALLSTARALQFDLDDLRDAEGHRVHDGDPYELRAEVSEAWISAALKDSEARSTGMGTLAGSITQQADGTVLLRASFNCFIGVGCARCLADSQLDAGGELCLTYVPEGQQFGAGSVEGEDGLELTAEALDEMTYRGRTLDLAATIREQLLLSIPMKPLCARGEDCRGLCGRCGNDLNQVDPEVQNCPKCGRALVEGVEDIDDDEPKAPSAWQAALSKFASEDEE